MIARRAVLIAVVVILGTLTGCSHSKSKNKPDKPTVLVPIKAQFEPRRVWSASPGKAEPKLRLGLAPAIDGNRVYGAGPHGDVLALDLATGHPLWRRHFKLTFSAGPGAGSGLVLIGTSGGTMLALAAGDGAERWRVQLNSELLAAPAIAGDLVVVRTVDGKLYGLNATDGQQRWIADQQVPRLSLRGTSAPLITGELAISGFDNGRLMAVSLASGNTAWDVAVGQAHGSSELQRLIDIDSPPVVNGDDLFAVAFQGRAVRLTRDTGHEIWSHEISSYRGLVADAVGVYVATAEGAVVRLDRASGAERWRQQGLLRRAPTAPVIQGNSIVVADIEGVIHWLSVEDGSFRARARSGSRVSAAPLVSGQLLVVQTDKGVIEAWRTPGG
jgi:outer membrane protein assembly factor BamB